MRSRQLAFGLPVREYILSTCFSAFGLPGCSELDNKSFFSRPRRLTPIIIIVVRCQPFNTIQTQVIYTNDA